jgi:hypothetical protein
VITNATIKRVDVASGVSAMGKNVYTEGNAVAVRCFQDTPRREQRIELGAVIEGAIAVLYVQRPPMSLAAGQRLLVLLDEETAPKLLEIQNVTPRIKSGGLSHQEVFVRQV